MKKLLLAVFVLIINNANAQINIPSELNSKLAGKTKFQDIKNTVLTHYTQKLSLLNTRDSGEQKQIMRQLKKWNRKFWIEEYYTNADGIVQDKNKMDYEAAKNLPINNNNTASRQATNWINQGPFNGDKGIGRIDKIAYHPTNANIMYAGSPHGGLFKTTNAGNSWSPVNGFLPSLGVASIAIDYTNPDIIYVLTGDANSTDNSFVNNYLYRSSSQGVFKSLDGGNSWLQTGTMSLGLYNGRELAMNPVNPNILIAATSKGVFRTDNGGISWTRSITTNNFYDVKYKPNSSNIVYFTSTDEIDPTPNNPNNADKYYDTKFYKSTNDGINFNIQVIPPNMSVGSRISIGVTPANPNKVMLLCGMNFYSTAFFGIYQSLSSGDDNSFTSVFNSTNLFFNTIGNNVNSDQSAYNNCIAISPTNENNIFVGGLCVWQSTNGGSNWAQKSAYWPSDNPYMHPDIHFLGFNPLNNYIYCGNDGGVYLYDNAANWLTRFQGLTTSQFFHFERENDEGDIWGGSQDNGILEQNGGGNYYNYSTGDGYDVMTDNDYLVANGDGDDIYMTVNNKILADPGPLDISVPGNTSFFANLGMSPFDEDRIYAGYPQGTYFSNDRGSNWTLAAGANPRPGNWCLAVARSNGNVYTAGRNGNIAGLYKYPDENTALDISPPLPYVSTLKITDIDIHPVNANIVYISVAGNTSNAKVFVTTNSGTTWSNWSFNLPNVPIFCIKRDGNDGVYVGTSIGVYYKRNGVSYWEYFSNGLPPTPVTEIEMWPEPNPVNNIVPSYAPAANPEIWISTFGRGIWFTKQYTANCININPLTGNVIGPRFDEATTQINSNQNIYSTGTDVRYNAGQKIVLTNGFKVQSGAKFKAKIASCGSPSE